VRGKLAALSEDSRRIACGAARARARLTHWLTESMPRSCSARLS
jgi:hypothetical protein